MSLFRGVTVGTTLTLDKGRWSKELRESKAELKAWSASAEKASTRMGSGWTKASKAFGHAVKYGFVAGGAAAAIGIGYAVKASMDFDQSMSKVKALTGATGKSFDGLRQQAILLGAKTTFSAGQAAQAMSELGAAGFSTTQIMTAMPGVLNAAAASGEDMASVASIMTATMNGFGLSAKNTAHIADVLAAAANDSSVSVADIGMSFKYVAPIAKVAHQSLENVAAVLAVLGNNGIKADTAGTSLRQGLLRVGTTGRDAYEALGISAFDAQGKMKALPTMVGDLHKALAGMSDQKRIAAIKAIFGVNASPAWALMIDKGPAQMEKLGQKYLKVDGAAKKMGLTMRDNVAGAWENFKGSLETVAISLDDLFKSKLKGGLQAAAAGFNQVTMALKGQGPHAKLVKQLITGIASGASVLKTILLQTGRAFVSSFRAASGGASGAAASFGGFAATVGQFAGTVLPAFASILGTTTGLLLSHKSAVLAAVGGYVAFKVASEVGTMLQGLNASLNIAGAAYGKLSAQQAIASLTAKGVAVSEAAVTVEIEAMTVAQKAATWAQLGFNKAITENPIGLVATGVALAAGAFLAWKSNSHDAESASDKATAANKRLLASMNAIRDANLASRSASFGYIDAVKHEKDATLAATAAGMKYGTHSKQYAAAQYEAARATAQREDAEARLGDAMKDRKTKSDNALKALRDDQQVMKDSGKNIDALRAAIGKMPKNGLVGAYSPAAVELIKLKESTGIRAKDLGDLKANLADQIKARDAASKRIMTGQALLAQSSRRAVGDTNLVLKNVGKVTPQMNKYVQGVLKNLHDAGILTDGEVGRINKRLEGGIDNVNPRAKNTAANFAKAVRPSFSAVAQISAAGKRDLEASLNDPHPTAKNATKNFQKAVVAIFAGIKTPRIVVPVEAMIKAVLPKGDSQFTGPDPFGTGGGGVPKGVSSLFGPMVGLAKMDGLSVTAGRYDHDKYVKGRPGVVSDHYSGHAVDFSNGVLTPQERTFAVQAAKMPHVTQVIHNGAPVGGKLIHAPGHDNHVHVAMYNRGTDGVVPGTGYSDTHPALLTPGEGVLNTDAVAAIGGANSVRALNRGTMRLVTVAPYTRKNGVHVRGYTYDNHKSGTSSSSSKGHTSTTKTSTTAQVLASITRTRDIAAHGVDPTDAVAPIMRSDYAQNLAGAAARARTAADPKLGLSSAADALRGSIAAQRIVDERLKSEKERIKAIRADLKAGHLSAKSQTALQAELAKRIEVVSTLTDKEHELSDNQAGLADTIVDLQKQIKEAAHQDRLDKPKTALQLKDAQLSLEKALADATASTDDNVTYLKDALAEEMDRQKLIRESMAQSDNTDAEMADLTSQLASSVSAVTGLTDELNTTSAGSSIADLAAMLAQVASSLNDAFNSENGNVFRGVTVSGDLNQHFTQSPNPDYWREATLHRLASIG